MYIFSYGSLIVPDSASAALGRTIEQDDLKEAVLVGFRRYWGGCSPIRFDALGNRVVNGAFYDILSVNGAFTMGVLLEIDKRDLQELCLREKQYDLLDVTRSVYGSDIRNGPVYTFIMKPEFRIDGSETDAYIPQNYESRIETSARRRGTHFFEHFVSTTINSNLQRISGSYTFADAEQQKRV